MAVEFLAVADLVACIPRARLGQYCVDDGGAFLDANTSVLSAMEAAEKMYFSRMLRHYPHDKALLLVQNDPILLKHVAWIACELASERREELTNAQGQGPYWTQYTRALQEIDLVSRGAARSVGEAVASKGANSGGSTSARSQNVPPTFIYAPNKKDGSAGPNGGAGGF